MQPIRAPSTKARVSRKSMQREASKVILPMPVQPGHCFSTAAACAPGPLPFMM
jgi:hypothetical protein